MRAKLDKAKGFWIVQARSGSCKKSTDRPDAGSRRRVAPEGKRTAILPTLGALHAGHASLMRLAREKADTVVVSTFVNPLQFGPSEIGRVIRARRDGRAPVRTGRVDILFSPGVEEMFSRGFSTVVLEDAVSKPFVRRRRAVLFRGMLTCWLKIFNIVRPDILIMGEKDPQQVAVLRKVAADLLLPVEIVTGPAGARPGWPGRERPQHLPDADAARRGAGGLRCLAQG